MFMRYRCWQTFCDVMLITRVRMGDMSCVISGLVLVQIAVDIEAYNKCETSLKYRYRYLQVIFSWDKSLSLFTTEEPIFFLPSLPFIGVSCILHSYFLTHIRWSNSDIYFNCLYWKTVIIFWNLLQWFKRLHKLLIKQIAYLLGKLNRWCFANFS